MQRSKLHQCVQHTWLFRAVARHIEQQRTTPDRPCRASHSPAATAADSAVAAPTHLQVMECNGARASAARSTNTNSGRRGPPCHTLAENRNMLASLVRQWGGRAGTCFACKMDSTCRLARSECIWQGADPKTTNVVCASSSATLLLSIRAHKSRRGMGPIGRVRRSQAHWSRAAHTLLGTGTVQDCHAGHCC